jgi:hypothetical protein
VIRVDIASVILRKGEFERDGLRVRRSSWRAVPRGPPPLRPKMYEMKVGLHGSAEEYDEDEDPDFGVGFEARRVAANRQRLRDQATLVVTIVLAMMVGILSLKMFDMNAMIVELRAAQVEPVRPRPDYVGAADAFVGGYSRQGHTLDVDGACRSIRARRPGRVENVTRACTSDADPLTRRVLVRHHPAAGELTSFHIGQECICECNGTSTGIFCRGANPMHSFLAVASTELDDDTWSMEHWSVDSAKRWRSTSRFGNTCVADPRPARAPRPRHRTPAPPRYAPHAGGRRLLTLAARTMPQARRTPQH